ncbi:SDR family oxidoreductase [Myxococcus stipitatus]|uniref:SDR family oxidoreductase n=1 Tax=Myxococcus stipitatus TaxID=83455 RepID=UPI0030D2AAF4
MRKLEGKTAIVTGASRGIGRVIAQRLARDGAKVAVVYAGQRDKAQEVVQAITAEGGLALALQADVSSAGDVKRMFDEVERGLGVPHIVIANAGTLVVKPMAEAAEEDYEKAFAVNGRGSFLTFSEAARRVPDGGRIIGFTTNLTLLSRPGVALYAASKAVVEQLVKGLARELGARKVTVNAVSPGPTDTEMLMPSRRASAVESTPLGRLGEPRDIADVVAFLVSEEARWITGQIVGVNGGII